MDSLEDRMKGYQFPISKLKTPSSSKRPVVLIACGSFSPITHMHVRLFGTPSLTETLALDSFHTSEYEVVGQYMSPVNDGYGKKGLVTVNHRLAMCNLATETTDIMIDDWEARHKEWVPTRKVLDHFEEALTSALNGIRPDIYLLCGTDLLDSFNTPGLWADEDMERILGHYGLVCIQRNQTDAEKLVASNALMNRHTKSIRLVNQWMNDITSSTILRSALSKGASIRYLTPDSVIEYIYKNGLYDVPQGSRPPYCKEK